MTKQLVEWKVPILVALLALLGVGASGFITRSTTSMTSLWRAMKKHEELTAHPVADHRLGDMESDIDEILNCQKEIIVGLNEVVQTLVVIESRLDR